MVMRNFDFERIDGLVGIYLLGATFALYIASMIISIVGKSEDVYTAVTLFDTAFYLVLAGALCLVAGVVLLGLNSQAAMSSGVKMDQNARIVVIGLIVLTLLSLILYAIIPNLV